jgi:hypothetical protein
MKKQEPYHPIGVSSQRCDACGRILVDGDQAIAHMYNPIVFCVPCAGDKEPTNESLCKAVIREPEED